MQKGIFCRRFGRFETLFADLKQFVCVCVMSLGAICLSALVAFNARAWTMEHYFEMFSVLRVHSVTSAWSFVYFLSLDVYPAQSHHLFLQGVGVAETRSSGIH